MTKVAKPYILNSFFILWIRNTMIVSQIYNYILTSIIIFFYLKYIPFLYWCTLDYFFSYILSYIIKNFIFIGFLLKCYYSYIYIYFIPSTLGYNISLIYFKLLNKTFNLKYLILCYYFYIWKIVKLVISYSSKIIFHSITNLIFLHWYIYNINNIKILIKLCGLYIIELLMYYMNLIYCSKHLYLNYINIYIFINIYYKVQNNIDILCSYSRSSRYKIYNWNKFSKRKKSYRYFFNTFFIQRFLSPTYKDHIITLETKVINFSFLRSDSLNNIINMNSYIKYWYWITYDFFFLAIQGNGPIGYSRITNKDLFHVHYKYIDAVNDIIFGYLDFWGKSNIHFHSTVTQLYLIIMQIH